MKFTEKPISSLVADRTAQRVVIVDQTQLPFVVEQRVLLTWQDCAEAIRTMRVRGAPLIGVTAAYGIALAMLYDATDESLLIAKSALAATRPTAVNLAWALDRMQQLLASTDPAERADAAWQEADHIAAEDEKNNRMIGEHGLAVICEIHKRTGRVVNILTHCNAGRMACTEWGTATAPIYLAHKEGLPVHVWVEETRPRNQGLITQWELANAGVSHTYIVDNAGGHLMQHEKVDMVIVGVDRVSRRGDVANKIGTYLKALAARDNGIPFYAAAPISSIDMAIEDGVPEIEIEERDTSEVSMLRGWDRHGYVTDVRLLREGTAISNPGFDVTPSRLVTGLITERGIFAPNDLVSGVATETSK
ncbi:MAG: S-methyl-5-thioribose-1-phosphate isomerase [Aeromicrobium sp.]|nr:S-methyl-5-thioribose-1-phosphate isomerase [Burkholderiales bacterium]